MCEIREHQHVTGQQILQCTLFVARINDTLKVNLLLCVTLLQFNNKLCDQYVDEL
jgi:hypothetical protein